MKQKQSQLHPAMPYMTAVHDALMTLRDQVAECGAKIVKARRECDRAIYGKPKKREARRTKQGPATAAALPDPIEGRHGQRPAALVGEMTKVLPTYPGRAGRRTAEFSHEIRAKSGFHHHGSKKR
jgi:hypothetical protein